MAYATTWINLENIIQSETNKPVTKRQLLNEPTYLRYLVKLIETESREFPGGPVVRTSYSHCRGAEFNPWSGN